MKKCYRSWNGTPKGTPETRTRLSKKWRWKFKSSGKGQRFQQLCPATSSKKSQEATEGVSRPKKNLNHESLGWWWRRIKVPLRSTWRTCLTLLIRMQCCWWRSKKAQTSLKPKGSWNKKERRQKRTRIVLKRKKEKPSLLLACWSGFSLELRRLLG